MTSLYGSWVWRKSSFSQGGGNSSCVEVGHWRTSSFSEGGGNSDCVEVGVTKDDVAVRDSKNPAGGTVEFPGHAWRLFHAKLTD